MHNIMEIGSGEVEFENIALGSGHGVRRIDESGGAYLDGMRG